MLRDVRVFVWIQTEYEEHPYKEKQKREAQTPSRLLTEAERMRREETEGGEWCLGMKSEAAEEKTM